MDPNFDPVWTTFLTSFRSLFFDLNFDPVRTKFCPRLDHFFDPVLVTFFDPNFDTVSDPNFDQILTSTLLNLDPVSVISFQDPPFETINC